MNPSQAQPAWLKWVCLIAGLGLILAAGTELYLIGSQAWPQWQKSHAATLAKTITPVPVVAPPGKPTNTPPVVSPITSAAMPAVTPLTISDVLKHYYVALIRDGICLAAGIWLVVFSNKKPRQTSTSAVMEASALSPDFSIPTSVPAFSSANATTGAPSKRWQSCNILQLTPIGRRLWTFTIGKKRLRRGAGPYHRGVPAIARDRQAKLGKHP